ncbi:MAG: allantoinase PuuE [Pseudomonadota bacterium]
MEQDYPRDMVGYGRHAPDPKWPGGAKLAVNIVLNYEEGGEASVLHGDPGSEKLLSEIVGAESFAGMRHLNMESLYEYGSRAGFWRLHRMLTEREIPVTVFGVTMAMARNPAAVAAMREAGWEIASHGLRWLDYQHIPEDVERAHLQEAVRLHTELTGERPHGFYLGKASPNTHSLVVEEGGFRYHADSYADDLPYWETRHGRAQLIVPYTLDVNDMRFATAQGFNTGEHFLSYLRDSVDQMLAEGDTRPAMLSVGLHCRLLGRPGRAAAFARFLDELMAREGIWITTRLAIADHWRARFPAPEGVA